MHQAKPEPKVKTAAAKPLSEPVAGVKGEIALTSRELQIESVLPYPIGACKLGTTLLIPKAPRALVVIVHGSGPMNRDGRAAGYHPYLDLAQGLAEAGYATARFDKRAAIPGCAEKLKETLRADHFLKDVETVAKTVGDVKELKGLPLVLLGHSEGVTYSIELTSRGRMKPAALVLLAGLGRYPIDATFLRQLRDQMTMPGLPQPTREKIEALLKQGETYFMRVREGEAKPEEFYVGAYAGFWNDMIRMTDQAQATAHDVRTPSLLLQGTDDKNVTVDDYEALKAALAKTPHAHAELIDGVDHMFATGGTTAVDPAVVEKIVTWLGELDLAAGGA